MHTEVHNISQMDRPSAAEAATLLRNSKADSNAKLKSHGSPVHHATAGKSPNKRIVQPKPTIPRIEHFSINAAADKPVANSLQ